MSEARKRVEAHVVRGYLVDSIVVWLKLAQKTGHYPEEVVNEAMEFGLPLILSSNLGWAPVLLEEGENGFSFPVGNADALASQIEHLFLDKGLRQQMGTASRRIVRDHSISNWAEAILSAVRESQRQETRRRSA